MIKEIQFNMGMGLQIYSVNGTIKNNVITAINKRFDKDLQKYAYWIMNDEQVLAVVTSDSAVEIYV
jgi:hypothetical protein